MKRLLNIVTLFFAVVQIEQSSSAMDMEIDLVLSLNTADIIAPSTQYVSPMFRELPKGAFWGIFQHAPSEIHYHDIAIGREAGLFFSYGMLPGSWDQAGDGVRFEIELITEDGTSHIPFSRYIDPKSRHEDREIFQEGVSLSWIRDTTATVILRCKPGVDDSHQNASYDWGFWGNPRLVSRGKPSGNEHPETNVLLITIDTCRADYCGPYGKDIRTPAMNRLAEEGIVFERAFSNSSTTNPSHASLLSSMLPYRMGIYGNRHRYQSSIPRLPQIFHEIGYQCAACVSAMHLDGEISGFGDGFQYYNGVDRKWSEIGQPDVAIYTRSAGATTSAALEWLRDHAKEPFFLWVHYYDPHAPYQAEGEFRRMYYDGDPTSPLHTSMDKARFFYGFDESFLAWLRPFRDLNFFRKEYKAEITYVDFQLNRLLDGMSALKADQNTLIVLTADHGEHLGERSIYFDHWTMYNADLHVPLIMHWPGEIPAGIRINEPVTLLDVAPTIVDLLDVADHPVAQLSFQGESLRPLWEEGASRLEERIHIAQGLNFMCTAGWNPSYKLIWEMIGGRYHEEFWMLPDRVYVFDVESDPQETAPVATFYWQDEGVEWKPWEVTGMPIHTEAEIMGRMERTMARVRGKRAPSPDELREWFTIGGERYHIVEELLEDETFFRQIADIMAAMLEETRPEPLDELLADVYARWKTLHDERGDLIMDETLLRALRDLGYVQ